MPRRRRAPAKRPHARKTARRAESFPLIFRIEEPLTDAINYVQAMYLMGYGLISHHAAGGDAIVALAEETEQRLEAVKRIWNEMLGERQRSRRQVGRLLDPKDGNVTLATLQRAARMVGRSLRLELV